MNMDKMLTALVKEHNKEYDLEKYNKAIKFFSMSLYNHEGYDNYTMCSDGTWLTRYEVKFTFKADDKWDDNIVKYQVNIYSNGKIHFYFDGTEWKSNK